MTMAGPQTLSLISLTGAPGMATLWRWGLVVLAFHAAVAVAVMDVSVWQMEGPRALRVGPVQTRWVAPEPVKPQTASAALSTQAPRTRLATLPPVDQNSPRPPSTPPINAESEPRSGPAIPEPLSPAELLVSQAAPSDSAPMVPSAQEPETTKEAEPADTPPMPEASPVQPLAAQAPAAEIMAVPAMALPALGLASLPASALLSYRLSGLEKGIQYQASGELRWQHNASTYAMGLSVRAFLVGSRHWRSQGQVTAQGLAPVRFSDSWRSERATHFDRVQNRIVFSSNAQTASLQPGAQDQISLYPQLAALMAQESGRLKPGTRLQVQTATVRDALPWLLTLVQEETLQLDGKTLQATQWVSQPRNRFDAHVTFWLSADHDWLPVRIRITQVSGSYIDLMLTGREPLPELPASEAPG